MRVAIALGASLLVLAGGLVAAVSESKPRLAGTNNVFDRVSDVTLRGGQELCQVRELVPGDTGAIRMHVAGPGSDVLAVRLRDGEQVIARGALAPGWDDGDVDVAVSPTVARTRADVSVCVANRGRGSVRFYGYGADETERSRVVLAGRPLRERIRLSYVRPGQESGWALAGTVAHRMGLGRGDWLEVWPFYAWLAALSGMVIAAVAVARRGLDR